MVIKTTILSFSLLLSIAGFSQNVVSDTSATCVAYWRKGDVKNIEITKTSRTLNAGKEKRSTQSSYGAIITVLDATDKGYVLQWQCKPGKDDQKYSFRDDVLNELYLNLKVIYTTDETGMFDSIVNYSEIRKFIDASIDAIGKEMGATSDSSKALDLIRGIFATRQSIEQLAMKDISLFHSPYGVEYSLRHPQSIDTEVPNFLGGEPFPAIVTLGLRKVDKKNDRANIYIRQKLDKEKTAAIMNKVLDKTASSLNKTFKESDK